MSDLLLPLGIAIWSVLVFYSGLEVGRLRGWAQGTVWESNRRRAARERLAAIKSDGCGKCPPS